MRQYFLNLLLLVLIASSHSADADLNDALAEAKAQVNTSPETSLALLNQALTDLGVDEIDPEEQPVFAELVELRAAIQRGLGRYVAAITDAERLADLGDRFNDDRIRARASLLIGSIKAEQGLYSDALERFHAARALLEDTEQPNALAAIHNAIGVTHNFAGDQERALSYFQQAVDSAREAGEDAASAVYLGNLALAVAQIDGPAAALPMLREVLQTNERLGNTSAATLAKGNICDQLIELERYDEADQQCLEAFEEMDATAEKRWQAGIRLALGNLRQRQGRLRDAENLYRDALDIASEAAPTQEDEILASLAEVLIDLERPAEALEILERRLAIRDQANETERRSLIEELEMRYEVQQSEAELELLRLQSELQGTQIKLRNQVLAGMLFLLGLACLSTIGAIHSYRVKARLEKDLARQNHELERALVQINELAQRDSLTSLLNRRALEELGKREVSLQQRREKPLSVVLMDVDFFKAVNDRYGHSVGDEVLQGFSSVLLDNLRDSDLVGRWGGEEFVCLLPEANLEDAEQLVRRIQTSLRSTPIETSSGSICLTVTAGISMVEDRLDVAINQADQAMYQGKHDGRDSIVIFEESRTSSQ